MNERQSSRTAGGAALLRRLAPWAGMSGPLLFVLVFAIEGRLRPGYDPLEMYVSTLSLGPRGWIQIANFVVFGALLFVFARGVAAEFPDGKASRAGPVILTVLAICYFLSGPFVTDPPGTPQDQMSIQGTLHGIFGAIVFLLMPTSCFVFLRRFRADPKWQSLQWWTAGLGTLSAAGVILLTIASKPPGLQNVFEGWLGLIQRMAIVPFMAWIFIFALELYRQDSR